MNRRGFEAALLACLGVGVGGCAVQTPVQPAPAAAAEVAASKVFASPVRVEYAFPSTDLDVIVKPASYQGSACSFPLALSGSFYATFDAVDKQAFRNLVAEGAPASYRVRFQMNSFDSSLIFLPGFWSGTAAARSEITLRVSVMDPAEKEIARQIIRGAGQAQASTASCFDGREAVAAAATKALRALAEEYADRVINPLNIP